MIFFESKEISSFALFYLWLVVIVPTHDKMGRQLKSLNVGKCLELNQYRECKLFAAMKQQDIQYLSTLPYARDLHSLKS